MTIIPLKICIKLGIIFQVPKRGCTAFSKLVKALAESGNCDAAMILDPENAARLKLYIFPKIFRDNTNDD